VDDGHSQFLERLGGKEKGREARKIKLKSEAEVPFEENRSTKGKRGRTRNGGERKYLLSKGEDRDGWTGEVECYGPKGTKVQENRLF